jgi:phenylacetate-CoA ligase
MEDVHDYVVECFSNDIGTDEILLHLLPSNANDETDRKIRAYLQAKLRVSPHVRFVDAGEMQQLQFPGPGRKPLRFIDRRH